MQGSRQTSQISYIVSHYWMLEDATEGALDNNSRVPKLNLQLTQRYLIERPITEQTSHGLTSVSCQGRLEVDHTLCVYQ